MSKPIFIVGMPRSGSTVFYNTLARHPDVAWISQASKKFPRSVALSRLMLLFRPNPRPTEGHRIWRKFVRAEDDSLGREHVTPQQRRYYVRLVQTHLRLQGKSRFLSKHPRNVLRLAWLDEIFPDALFLHLVRDARAVAQSILQMRETHGGRDVYWGIRPPGWRAIEMIDPVESIARQWKLTLETARDSAARLAPERSLEVRYEDFCEDPATVLRQVGAWADLAWPDELLERACSGIESRNHKWQDAFETTEVATIESVLGDSLTALGYEPESYRITPERIGSTARRVR